MEEEFRDTELNGVKLRVYRDGTIMRYIVSTSGGYRIGWKLCVLKPNNMGYYIIFLNIGKEKRGFLVHRIIAMVYLGLDITNTKLSVDHIDRCTINNNINNLRVISQQENTFNSSSKGYWYIKKNNKWRARICLNSKQIHLGYFDNEEDARNAYLEAKAIYHVITPPHLQEK
jgi:hypothetical protein